MDRLKLLGEIEALLRVMPPTEKLTWDSEEILVWTGRASALMDAVGQKMSLQFVSATLGLDSRVTSFDSAKRIVRLVHQAREQLRLETVGPVNVAIGAGAVFEYFDEVRQIIETASSDLFFVDPYMGADFVSRYLPHVKAGVSVRLLTKNMIPQLTPALQAFKSQHGVKAEARRSAADIHDRWLFVDKATCYQSGASFKDGATKAPTTLTQLQDMFTVVHQQYETIWTGSPVIPV